MMFQGYKIQTIFPTFCAFKENLYELIHKVDASKDVRMSDKPNKFQISIAFVNLYDQRRSLSFYTKV